MSIGASVLETDPGNPLFVEVAERLRIEGELQSSLLILLRGLSANPSLHKGRLILAHVLYQLECVPFAVREVQQLVESVPESESLKKLLLALAPDGFAGVARSSAVSEEEVVAATEFDLDIIDLIGSEEKK